MISIWFAFNLQWYVNLFKTEDDFMFLQAKLDFSDNGEFGKIWNKRPNGWYRIEVIQAMAVPQVVTEWNKLLVSLKKSSVGIGKSNRLGCLSSTMW